MRAFAAGHLMYPAREDVVYRKRKPRKKQGFCNLTRLPARGRELAAFVLTHGELAEESLAYAQPNLGQYLIVGIVAVGWKTCRQIGCRDDSRTDDCVPAQPTQEALRGLC